MGNVVAEAKRLSYIGETGWELYVRPESAAQAYGALHAAAERAGVALTDAGYYALDALRIEKGMRAWGHELDPSTTPLDVGMKWAVAWNKESDFIGRDALFEQRERVETEGHDQRIVSLVLDEATEPMLWGGEPIAFSATGDPAQCDIVGLTTSAAYGHTVGAPVALGYIRPPPSVARTKAERAAFYKRRPLESGAAGNGQFFALIGQDVVPASMRLGPALK